MSDKPPGEPSNKASGRGARPETVEAALALALRHGRNAIAEALLSAHALLDAAAIGLTGRPIESAGELASQNEAVRALARVVEGLDALAARLHTDDAEATRRLVDALLAALDSEITRWETKAHSDPDARAVLRAFLGLRELLWELGLRARPAGASPESTQRTAPPSEEAAAPSAARKRRRPPRTDQPKPQTTPHAAPRRRRRVQRVDIES